MRRNNGSQQRTLMLDGEMATDADASEWLTYSCLGLGGAHMRH